MSDTPQASTTLDIIARELHELMRLSNPGCPAWDDLDPAKSHEAGLIQMAREKAREFIPSDDPAT
ncbi:hypothetical protein VQ02_08345 [Methylobacterium variabile]|jgi:hypothetical protein|uniref:Uncharacterized protein n=1 Tax=Methylobacterium variabile TaxID=298794 RepID=A0A0J6T2H3_9HYPH|nr:hypothetical protein [Methylobacterium variabile]KMO40194.1 hypothetical protein VQ02_08345 [Methylobacterium variabile]